VPLLLSQSLTTGMNQQLAISGFLQMRRADRDDRHGVAGGRFLDSAIKVTLVILQPIDFIQFNLLFPTKP
jgi:hypothetical protein